MGCKPIRSLIDLIIIVVLFHRFNPFLPGDATTGDDLSERQQGHQIQVLSQILSRFCPWTCHVASSHWMPQPLQQLPLGCWTSEDHVDLTMTMMSY